LNGLYINNKFSYDKANINDTIKDTVDPSNTGENSSSNKFTAKLLVIYGLILGMSTQFKYSLSFLPAAKKKQNSFKRQK
jgi:hypothetical protein